MINRLEHAIASDLETVLQESESPLSDRLSVRGVPWTVGVSVAVSAIIVIIGLALGGAIIGGLIFGEGEVASPNTTSRLPDPALDAYFAGVIVAEGSTVRVTGAWELEVDCCVTMALSDLDGGVVYQVGDDRIMWARSGPSGVEEPVLLATPEPGETISLESVGSIDGRTTAVYMRETADRVRISALDLSSGLDSEFAEPPNVVQRASLSDSLFVLSVVDGSETRLEFRRADGSHLALSTNPHPEPGDSIVSEAALTPEGDRIAFIERPKSRADGGLADFVVWDLTTGSEISRHNLASLGDRIISFDGERLSLWRSSANPVNPPVMVTFHLTANLTMSQSGGIGLTQP